MNKNYQSKEGILKKIIRDNFPTFESQELHKLPSHYHSTIKNNVVSFLGCKDIRVGFASYICTHCQNIHIIPHTCKSNLCSSCGASYAHDWVQYNSNTLIDCTHRHVVFTIPKEFRRFILDFPDCYLFIFEAISKTIHEIFFHCKAITTPGFIIALHTFGDSLAFKPHFHVVLAEGGFKADKSFVPFSHWPFKAFRKKWQFLFLKAIKKFASLHTDSFTANAVDTAVNHSFKTYLEGFYIYANQRFEDAKSVLKYIGRYLARPPLSLNSIIHYDGVNVTFLVKDTEKKSKKRVVLSALQFLGRIFYHLPQKHFKSIRRFGFYARNLRHLAPFIKKKRNSLFKVLKLSFRDKMILQFNIDPLICTSCGNQMILAILFHFSMISPIHPITLDLYKATG